MIKWGYSMRFVTVAVCIALAAAVAPFAQVSAAWQASSVVTSCRTSSAAEAYDCDCFGREEASIRQALAQENFENTRVGLEASIKKAEARPPSKVRDDQLARLRLQLAANKVDPVAVDPQYVTLRLVSANMCKAPSNFERLNRDQCLARGEGDAFCACFGAAHGKLWANSSAQMSQQMKIDFGTQARMSCQAGGKPLSVGSSGQPANTSSQSTQPSSSAIPGVSLPSIPNVNLPAGIPSIQLPGNSSGSGGAQCGLQTCKSNQKCVTEKVFGVAIPQCK